MQAMQAKLADPMHAGLVYQEALPATSTDSIVLLGADTFICSTSHDPCHTCSLGDNISLLSFRMLPIRSMHGWQ